MQERQGIRSAMRKSGYVQKQANRVSWYKASRMKEALPRTHPLYAPPLVLLLLLPPPRKDTKQKKARIRYYVAPALKSKKRKSVAMRCVHAVVLVFVGNHTMVLSASKSKY